MERMKNLLAWFEIPVLDMSRAKTFYETVLDIEITTVEFGGFKMGWFPRPEEGAAGSLVQHEAYKPSTEGSLIYFASDDLALPLSRVEQAGGKVLQEKTQISEDHGYMAVFTDTEGNRIALHSMS
ncbi:MAG: glyoxalase [Leeuwenhoekiella sp.]|nr:MULTISPECIES: VOC family protein [unclassified Leeuwenhoekiella]MAW94729.1 glyoxalase [Leeuwenhoekiella sp.]MAW95504.1 glyoxalase [Leeuwenhoekiella sp.]MBA82152.1 glyoxalase [Leeuwenhoekiella sp.]|tara:strand:+ start:3760 stop:4134 length:375 start_codon:yes stop_codon:yes gene_type:complete